MRWKYQANSVQAVEAKGVRTCCRGVYQRGMDTHKEWLLDSVGPETNGDEMVMKSDTEN